MDNVIEHVAIGGAGIIKQSTNVDIIAANKADTSTMDDYSKMTIKELTAFCREKGIKGYSRKKKAELINMICSLKTRIVSEEKISVKTDENIEQFVKAEKIIQKSKNSLVAKNGNLAEDILCKSSDILDKLGAQYFKKKIVFCEKINKKKSDLRLTFNDGTSTTIQLKNGNGGGRGWSFDRRPLSKMPTNESVKELINIVCLKSSGERKIIPNDKTLLSRLLLGDEEKTKPQYFIHTTLKNDKITSLSICPVSLFIDTVVKNAFENCNAKRTCVHLTPYIYLQRKAGGKEDHSPDDIQAKLRCMPNCMIEIIVH